MRVGVLLVVMHMPASGLQTKPSARAFNIGASVVCGGKGTYLEHELGSRSSSLFVS